MAKRRFSDFECSRLGTYIGYVKNSDAEIYEAGLYSIAHLAHSPIKVAFTVSNAKLGTCAEET